MLLKKRRTLWLLISYHWSCRNLIDTETIGRIASANGLDRKSANTAVGASNTRAVGCTHQHRRAAQWRAEIGRCPQNSMLALSITLPVCSAAAARRSVPTGIANSFVTAGGDNHTALTGAIARSPMGHGTSSSLLGCCARVVMGTIAKQPGPRGIDPNNMCWFVRRSKRRYRRSLAFRNARPT